MDFAAALRRASGTSFSSLPRLRDFLCEKAKEREHKVRPAAQPGQQEAHAKQNEMIKRDQRGNSSSTRSMTYIRRGECEFSPVGDSGMVARPGSWLTNEVILSETRFGRQRREKERRV